MMWCVAQLSSTPSFSQSIVSSRTTFNINFPMTWIVGDANPGNLEFRWETPSGHYNLTDTSSLIC